ncbi:venom carboxylesterase-6-like [Phymastichus coffea]|uniref:venom carboxylesterase-6-like n=1 Tax=Phymastichus coffea TaxID=108790 RepID=UPI00273CE855|nr:venom carboxylesterase-6-like [Phymastichus coffea]
MNCTDFILKLLLLKQHLSNESSCPLVSTKSGKIHGKYLTSYQNNIYEAYQGIPYALPPIGERRFRPPVAVENWLGELQATQIKDACLQDSPSPQNNSVVGSEDCLYLNIYVPTKRKPTVKLPVLFYIYGGAFRFGRTAEGQESYVIDYDVIFASANYRMGSLGFLSTDDHVVQGNMGLKDQSMALRWIHDNIEHFGGNPDKITLIGASAGGVSVHYHYLSPWSRGLFHAGISLSGSAYIPAAVTACSRIKTVALAKALKCTHDDMGQLVECLRRVPAEALVSAQKQLKLWQRLPPLFGPVIERSGADPFIDDYPSDIMSQGKAYDVPWVTGVVSEEGLAVSRGFTQDTLQRLDKNWNSVAAVLLDYSYTVPKEQHKSVVQRVRRHYFGNQPINVETLHTLTKLIGDRHFGVGAVNAAKAQAAANSSPVFFYYHTYRAQESLSDGQTFREQNFGVAHGDDIHLVIKDPRMSPTKSANDMTMQRHLIKIWTSVAYNGVPKITVQWPRVAPNNSSLQYLLIAEPNCLIPKSCGNFAQQTFWNSIISHQKICTAV